MKYELSFPAHLMTELCNMRCSCRAASVYSGDFDKICPCTGGLLIIELGSLYQVTSELRSSPFHTGRFGYHWGGGDLQEQQ